jgi:hypothetical protein
VTRDLQRRRDRVARVNAKRPDSGVDVDHAENDNRLPLIVDVLAEIMQEIVDAKAGREGP